MSKTTISGALTLVFLFFSDQTFAQLTPPLMRDFVGVNVKSQLPANKMSKVGFARNFHLWADDQGNPAGGGATTCPFDDPNDPYKIRWNPSRNQNRFIRYDDFYKLNPQRTVAVLHGNAPSMYGNLGNPGLVLSDALIRENGSSQKLTVQLTYAAPTNIQLSIAQTGGSVTLPSSNITIWKGQKSAEFEVVAINNGASSTAGYSFEMLTFTVTSGNAMMAKNTIQLFIEDDEMPNAPPMIYMQSVVGTEGGGVYPEFRLTKPYSAPVEITVNCFGGTAANTPANGSQCSGPFQNLQDYFFCTNLPQTITIPAGELASKLVVVTYDDNQAEQSEYFNVSVQSTSPSLLPVGSANAWIVAGSPQLYGKPICADVFDDVNNHNLPLTYIQLAQRASVFGARYGASPVLPPGFETVMGRYVELPENTNLGQGTVRFVELMNETDASWHGADGVNDGATALGLENNPSAPSRFYFRPDQYAALMSAAYDGNRTFNASGNATPDPDFAIRDANGAPIANAFWGLKNIAPHTTVVLAGTADLRYDYLALMKKYWDANGRADHYPFDVVNYHFYSTQTHPIPDKLNGDFLNFYRGRRFFGGTNNSGIYPEATNIQLRKRLSDLLADRADPDPFDDNTYNQSDLFPNKPTWITEFGYDSDADMAGSMVDIVPFGGLSRQTIQGQWLTRYILEAAAAKSGTTAIQKVFLYELNDDPGLGAGQFGSCGLLKKNGTQKKSWYHILTMKSVLDATRFEKTNEPSNQMDPTINEGFLLNGSAVIEPFDTPRIYTFLRNKSVAEAAKPNLVAWSPTGINDDHFKGSLLLLKTKYPSITSIQAIEVLEYDEDGRRTKIDPSLISSVTINSKGYWKVSGIRPGDTHLTLTETPTYFRVNQAYSESDPIVEAVKNLKSKCSGCNSAKIEWEYAINPSYYSIYRQAFDCTAVVPTVFDTEVAELVMDRLPGASRNAVISGLDDSKCYVFWVLPFVSKVNGNTSLPVTVTAPDMSAPQSGAHYIVYNAMNMSCGPCYEKLAQSQITFTPGMDYDPVMQSGLLNSFYEALIPSDQPNNLVADYLCRELQGTPDFENDFPLNANLGFLVPTSNPIIQFTIDLNKTSFIDVINLFYRSGTGRVTFEILRDCCSEFVKYKVIDFNDNTQGATNSWYIISNEAINKQRTERIRVTVECLEESGFTIGRLLFCTTPTPDLCAGDWYNNPNDEETFLVTPPSNPDVKNVDPNSAVLTWDAAKRFVNNAEIEPVNQYIVQYSIAKNTAGDLLLPKKVEYQAPDWGGDIELPLTQLVPNTTYFVEIEPNSVADLCKTISLPPDKGTPFSFTTPDWPELSDSRSKTVVQKTADIEIYPNPASSTLSVKAPTGVFDRYQISFSNGIFAQQGHLTDVISLSGLSNGMYLITFFGANVQPRTKAFVLMKD